MTLRSSGESRGTWNPPGISVGFRRGFYVLKDLLRWFWGLQDFSWVIARHVRSSEVLSCESEAVDGVVTSCNRFLQRVFYMLRQPRCLRMIIHHLLNVAVLLHVLDIRCSVYLDTSNNGIWAFEEKSSLWCFPPQPQPPAVIENVILYNSYNRNVWQ